VLGFGRRYLGDLDGYVYVRGMCAMGKERARYKELEEAAKLRDWFKPRRYGVGKAVPIKAWPAILGLFSSFHARKS